MDFSSGQQKLFQRLAHNQPLVRQDAMKTIRSYLVKKDDMTKLDMDKFWEGLFFCMWMSDKTPVQQELCRSLAASIHLFKPEIAVMYYQSFLDCMGRRWHTIDQHRVDKYLSLVRRFIEAGFLYCRSRNWDVEIVKQFSQVHETYFKQVLNFPRPVIIFMCDIFINSWAMSFSQDVFFRPLDPDTPTIEDESHMYIDMSGPDVDAAIAQSSNLDLTPISWTSLQLIISPIISLLNFASSDPAIVNALQDNFFQNIEDIIVRLITQATMSAEQDEDEDAAVEDVVENNVHDFLAPTLIENYNTLIKFIYGKCTGQNDLLPKVRTRLFAFHATLVEYQKRLIKIGLVESIAKKKTVSQVSSKKAVVEKIAPPVVEKSVKKRKTAAVDEEVPQLVPIKTFEKNQPVVTKKKITSSEKKVKKVRQ